MDERTALLAMTLVEGLGPVRIRRLEDRFGSAAEAWENRRHWRDVRGVTERLVEKALRITQRDIERQLEGMERLGARFIADDEPDYPEGLVHLPNAPRVLFVRGRLPRRSEECVAVVGTRRPSPTGEQVAETLGRDLAAVGLVVVSGMARGIDAAAHKGALKAKGLTVAVLGCGLDVAYPPEHKDLMEEIGASGALVSEYPLGIAPTRSHFPLRNRIIAGLSQGVVLVECGQRSGALYTANIALELGREVMAVPGDVIRWQSDGPNSLIRQGATLVRHAADVLLALGWTTMPKTGHEPEAAGPNGRAPLRPAEDASDAVQRYLLHNGPATADELAAALQMPVADVAAALTWLELLGRVRRERGGRFASFG